MDGQLTFGQWLRRRRRSLDWTQRDLAQRVGYATDTLRQIEADELRPSREMAEALAETLGVPPTERATFVRFARDRHVADDSLAVPAAPAAPVPIPSAPRLASLPTPPSALIGRQAEMAAVKALLSRADTRLVTLTGVGGTGKTRLALEVAAHLVDDFSDGVSFVNLAPLSDPSLVVSAIAQALDIREQPGQALIASVLDTLRERRALLLLDNFEQVVEAAPAAADLLAGAPHLKLLVTSRSPLHLRGEHEFAVPPLATPDVWRLPPLAELAEYEAVRLFSERAQAVQPGFALTQANAPAVAAICQRLDGLPLAIELAAARVKVLPPQALLARLGSRLAALTGGPRDAPLRQRTLRATLAWSYDLLGEAEQRLFRRLGVFVGGATMEAMGAVAGGERLESGDWGLGVSNEASPIANLLSPISLLDGLAALVDQNLVVRSPGVDDEPRFGMLETIREYALERLAESGEEEALRQRHAEYFRALVEDNESRWEGSQAAAWQAMLEVELDNLRAALAWSVAAPGRGETGLRLAGALDWFWLMSGYLSEGRTWLAAVLVLPEAAPSSALRAKALLQLGRLAVWQSDHAEARAALGESARIYRKLGDKRGLGEALGQLGHALSDYDVAQPIWEESVAALREAGAAHTLGLALRWLGLSHMANGNFDAARVVTEESLQLFQRLENSMGIGIALTGLGQLAEAEGDYAAARRWFEQALVWRERAGEKYGIATLAVFLAQAALLQGDAAAATVYAQRGLRLCREIGSRIRVAEAYRILGDVACAQGETTQAMDHFRQSLALLRGSWRAPNTQRSLRGIARVWQASGQSARAARLLGAAARLSEGKGGILWPRDRTDLDEMVTVVRFSLGEDEFAVAWAEGRAMTLDEAAAYALGE